MRLDVNSPVVLLARVSEANGVFVLLCVSRFLQKARKEVLTRRYDPHGKMRRLGLSMEPPPPPDFCRLEATAVTPLAAQLSPAQYGEDNMAYCVSRSPSTDQQNQQQQQQQQQQQHHPGNLQARRSLYHTYHDSGISAGGLAALTESRSVGDAEDRSDTRQVPGGLAYRTCPDSGVSGLSLGFYMPGDPACQQPSCYLQDQIYHEDQYHQRQQQQRQSMHQLHQQQQQQLHHTLVQASVHPTHGVCYGDDTNHPQSPQHYAPPPHHLQHQENFNHQYPLKLHQNDSRIGNFTAQIHSAACSSSSPHKEGPRRCSEDNQVFELVSPSATHPKDVLEQDFTTETSFGPQGALDIMVTSSSDPRIANISLPAQQSIVLSCLVQQQQQQQQHLDQLQQLQHSASTLAVQHNHHLTQQQQQQQQQHTLNNATPAIRKASLPSGSTASPQNHHRDSGINEDTAGGNGCSNGSSGSSTDQSGGSGCSNNTITRSTSSSERPDSQASHSPSTTDSEDSGFRGSHCANSAPLPSDSAPVPTSRLNKQTNPLLKPMRRPRNKGSRKNAPTRSISPPKTAKGHAPCPSSPAQREPNTIANTDSSNPGSPTPLITLDPQNLSPPALTDSPGFGRGLEMIDMAGRGGPTSLRTPDSSPHHSPPEWSGERGSSRKNSKEGLGPGGVNGGVALGDISTHLSWSYLQGMSSGQRGVARPEGGASHRRQDMHHMDVLGYSVV